MDYKPFKPIRTNKWRDTKQMKRRVAKHYNSVCFQEQQKDKHRFYENNGMKVPFLLKIKHL